MRKKQFLIYIRADHDSRPYWPIYDNEKGRELQDLVYENDEIFIFEYLDFIILGINNRTYQMNEAEVDPTKEIVALENPTIVIKYVSYDCVVDRTFD